VERSVGEPDIHGFEPDGPRAARHDRVVRLGLADSLRTVFDSLDQPVDGGRREALLAAIEAGSVQPAVFGTYVELVVALFDERTAEAQGLVEDLLGQPLAPASPLRIVALDDRELGPGQADRYRRLVSDDILVSIDQASPAARARATAVLDAAIDLLRGGAPGVFDEVRGLIREIVLVDGQCHSDRLVVGGAVTFSLWGSQIMVADQVNDRLTAALQLAHEASHAHLFGLALGGRLVENDDDIRYPSPLRPDPRPMEGVAHATYVLAREVYTLRSLVASGRLTDAEDRVARDQIEAKRRGFGQGLATLMGDAIFTAAGRAAFDRARLYMDGRD
jgi:HEXXH motif-containing protein